MSASNHFSLLPSGLSHHCLSPRWFQWPPNRFSSFHYCFPLPTYPQRSSQGVLLAPPALLLCPKPSTAPHHTHSKDWSPWCSITWTGLIPYTLPLTHSVPATLAFLVFLKHDRHSSILSFCTGCCLCLGNSSPGISISHTPSLPSGLHLDNPSLKTLL